MEKGEKKGEKQEIQIFLVGHSHCDHQLPAAVDTCTGCTRMGQLQMHTDRDGAEPSPSLTVGLLATDRFKDWEVVVLGGVCTADHTWP